MTNAAAETNIAAAASMRKAVAKEAADNQYAATRMRTAAKALEYKGKKEEAAAGAYSG